MNLENLLFPVLLVVGQSLQNLDVELVTMFSCLTRTVLDPTKEKYMVQDVGNHVELDNSPPLDSTCPCRTPISASTEECRQEYTRGHKRTQRAHKETQEYTRVHKSTQDYTRTQEDTRGHKGTH
jgi:hypothetical protein